MKWIAAPLVAALIAVGCVGGGSAADPESALSLVGPGGVVAIGDPIDEAKKAFPAPKGVQPDDAPLALSFLYSTGWSWTGPDGESFEAATKDGKIVMLAHGKENMMDSSKELDAQHRHAGKETRKAENRAALLAVWDRGEYARFLLVIKESLPLMGQGGGTMIGRVDDLKLLNFRADDPESFVKALELVLEKAPRSDTNAPKTTQPGE